MKFIEYTGTRGKGKKFIVDDETFDKVNAHKWTLDKYGYARTNLNTRPRNNRSVSLQRFLMNTPPGMDTDHINRNKSDYRLSNLRVVSHQQNMWNMRRSDGTSKYKGVCWDKQHQKWLVQIYFNNQKKKIGRFVNEIHAAMAYDIWAKEFYGEYAQLNFA